MNRKSTLVIVALSVTLSLTLTSCEKENIVEEPAINQNSKFKIKDKQAYAYGGSNSYVSRDFNGDYVSPFAGGLNFGQQFTYPTTMNSSMNGMLWGPSFSGISGVGIISYEINGAYLTVFSGTFVNGISGATINSISQYKAAYKKYLQRDPSQLAYPVFSDYTAQFGGNASGIILTQAMFVLDMSSPTTVSIAPVNFTTTAPPVVSTQPEGYLGKVFNGIDEYELTGYSGTITNVTRVSNNIRTEITDFTGQYLHAIRTGAVSVDLTINPSSQSPLIFQSVNVLQP